MDDTLDGTSDGFITILNQQGDSLLYSSFIGGSDFDSVNSISLDSEENVYLAGETHSGNFPTVNPIDRVIDGLSDCFVMKLDPYCQSIQYSTLIGGGLLETPNDIAVDNSGRAYVIGETTSRNFPLEDSIFGVLEIYDNRNCFIFIIDSEGTSLEKSSVISGESGDIGKSVVIDPYGYIYLTGSTHSSNFPTINSYNNTFPSQDYHCFVLKIDPACTEILFSTFVSGNLGSNAESIEVDLLGNSFVTGSTKSEDFPTANAIDNDYENLDDGFLFKLPDMSDSDADGLTDYNESIYNTDRFDNDTDNDGLPDGWEIRHGLNPTIDDSLDDPDLDGLANYLEFEYDTDPFDSDSDDDSFSDGWEIQNGFLPTDPELELVELIIYYLPYTNFIILGIIAIAVFQLLKRRNKNIKLQKQIDEKYKEKMEALKALRDSVEESQDEIN